MHGAPGSSELQLTANERPIGSRTSFAGATRYARLPDGELALRVREGNRTVAETTRSLGGGSYTVVAVRRGGRVALPIFRDGRARGGTARLRTINAAPELGPASVRLDGRTLGDSIRSGAASSYDDVDPGTYELDVTRPGGRGAPLVSRPGLALSAGTASTAVVLGTAGERTRIILLPDDTAAPERPPAAGLGGLSGEVPWGPALLAALLAGAVGAGGWTLARRRAI